MTETKNSAGASARKEGSAPGQLVTAARKSAPKNISAVVTRPMTASSAMDLWNTRFAPA